MDLDKMIEEIQDRYADTQGQGGTVLDAIGDVLNSLGYAMISKQHYRTLLAYRNKYAQILKIVEQSHTEVEE